MLVVVDEVGPWQHDQASRKALAPRLPKVKRWDLLEYRGNQRCARTSIGKGVKKTSEWVKDDRQAGVPSVVRRVV